MLDRQTGKVLHIDFGDCFEVAMHREKYPEKGGLNSYRFCACGACLDNPCVHLQLVPFRLTRMLVNAMEVAGIEGHFRYTCEKVSYSIFCAYLEVCPDNIIMPTQGHGSAKRE